MAIATIDTFLMYKGDTAYEKLVDITEFPDLGSAPESIDVTTLSDKVQKNLIGLQQMDNLEFSANYSKDDYKKIQALADGTDRDFAVLFGCDASGAPDGHNGIVTFSGGVAVYVKGGGVNEAVGMGISVACSKTPELVDSLPTI